MKRFKILVLLGLSVMLFAACTTAPAEEGLTEGEAEATTEEVAPATEEAAPEAGEATAEETPTE